MIPPPRNVVPARAYGVVVLVAVALFLFILDRQILAVLKTTLKSRMNWSDVDYSLLVTAFTAAQTVGCLFLGRFIDWAGTRVAASLSIAVMSIATIVCGMSVNLDQMLVSRAILGFADAGVTLAAVVAVVRWFPSEKRATAISIKTPIGMMGFVVAPPLVALIAGHHDWRYAFYVPGAIGLAVPVLWWWLDHNPPAYGEAPNAIKVPALPLRALLKHRALWGITLARLIVDPVWIFYVNWQPGYLQEGLGLSLADIGRYAWIPPVASSALALIGGMVSDGLIRRGVAPVRSRVYVMQSLALFGATLWLLPFSRSLALALGVFACIHMVYSQWNNLSGALIADTLPKGSTGTVFGLIGFLVGLTGSLINLAIGAVIHAWGYSSVFLALGLLYPLGALALWFFYLRTPPADSCPDNARSTHATLTPS